MKKAILYRMAFQSYALPYALGAMRYYFSNVI
jgi:hypothetical protein